MIEYDAIAIGTGSAMNVVEAILSKNSNAKIAVVDKDEPGGICLTKACIPTKILLYPAELIRNIEKAKEFGIDAEIKKIDFKNIMERMHSKINPTIKMIERGLSSSSNIDYYREVAEFVEPYTMKVGDKLIKSNLILLCSGSKPSIPHLKGLDGIEYHTSDTILNISRLPESLAIIGGGYVAAEYGHFFSCMGSKVTIIGRNPRFVPSEEPEISELLRREMGKHMSIITNHEVKEVRQEGSFKEITIVDRKSGEKKTLKAEEILIATGRASNSDILKPEKGGIETDERGWIKVNEYLESTQKNVWAFGDAIGKHMFKHVANYESKIVYYNAVLGRKVKVDYHAVPHAIFTYPEVAGVGMKEEEAIKTYGKERIAIGFHKYEDTGKGEAMGLKNYFFKVIIDRETNRILGAHTIGPYASILIQEVVNLMYTKEQSSVIYEGMHIHPSLSEAVERAFYSLMDVETYHHLIKHLISF